MTAASRAPMPGQVAAGRPRLGFLGTGWIGRHRLQAVAESGLAEIAAIADPSPEMLASTAELAPEAARSANLEALLDRGLDGVVIATPSALHAEQAIRALERGAAVFCQKPLGRTGAEAAAVVEAARRADRLLGLDLSYRFTEGMRRIREIIASGGIGRAFAAELTFHNAFGPDKAWFYDPALSGGGCVMDLGVHLVDLALWSLGFPRVESVEAQLYAGGERLGADPDRVEDYATAVMSLEGGTTVRLACSWRLHAGQDAEIAAVFHGAEGGLAFRNVNGSFYDFEAERYRGTSRETLCMPPDPWSGRAVVDWARRLAGGAGFDPHADDFASVAAVLDRIYRRQPAAEPESAH